MKPANDPVVAVHVEKPTDDHLLQVSWACMRETRGFKCGRRGCGQLGPGPQVGQRCRRCGSRVDRVVRASDVRPTARKPKTLLDVLRATIPSGIARELVAAEESLSVKWLQEVEKALQLSPKECAKVLRRRKKR
jgi:hypothetical protein